MRVTGRRIETLNEVKPIENINKSMQSFLETSSVQKKVLISHKLQDHACEEQNPFGLNEDNPPQRICQNQLCHASLSQ